MGETRPGSVLVTIEADGQLREEHFPFRVLAHHHWVLAARTPELSVELLAAFVLPHHPVVAEVLTGAREQLRRTTGDPSTSGYQHWSTDDQCSVPSAR